jgi:hypothetical protein
VLRGGRIEQALRTRLTEENRQALLAFMATMPESEAVDAGLPATDARSEPAMTPSPASQS